MPFQSLAAFLLLLLTFTGPASAETARIVILGDSLTAGFGVDPENAFPDQLQRALSERGHDVEIVNGGVSGDTASDGLARVDWTIGPDASAVIVELGANDALRGVDPAITRDALDQLIARLAERGLPVLLAGMLAPPNLGSEYGDAFNAIYPDLAARYDTLLYPFFLDGVAAEPDLNQADGIHPNAEGVAVIVERILPSVEDLIEEIPATTTTGALQVPPYPATL